MFLFNIVKLFLRFLAFIDHVISAFGKFVKSSYLSLLFLGMILLLVQAMEQANTLLVDMIETDKASLIFCFIAISVFASVLSHYPRYIYYAENINDSRDDHQWYAYKWLGYPIFIFSKIDKSYKQDYQAKFFRHFLGLIIFIIWHYYIYQTFYPKLVFNGYSMANIQVISLLLTVIPSLFLIVLLYKFDEYQERLMNVEDDGNVEKIKEAKVEKKKFVTLGVTALLLSICVVIVYAFVLVFTLKFSLLGYWFLQVFTFLLALMYILFRVFRVQVITVYYTLNALSNSVGYLRYYFVFAVVVLLFLLYSNLAVYNGWKQANAMLILLGYLFFFYYIIACLVKYYFMLSIFKTQKKDLENLPKVTEKSYLYTSGVKPKNRRHLVPLSNQKDFSRRRSLIASVVTMVVIVLIIVSFNSETAIHELEIYNQTENEDLVEMETFKEKLRERSEKPLFFVAAHGGGLKANIWTMKVINQIQLKTQGDFLNQTISFSGASGGMMGLSLYSVADGAYTNNYDAIDLKINQVAAENFASKDLALTLGFDGVRKLFPFNKIGNYRDRSYYAMVTYRNILENRKNMTLDSLSFQAYWKNKIYDNSNHYFPSLIINTAKTNGKRGVFYSVKYPQDSTLFYNSDNLSQLYNGSIAFYEALSSTNRFPAFSPAAKIKNYGHYIDAGAIDNSGLLSSIDLHNYLLKDSTLNGTKKVFVEIINGRDNYIWHLIQKFKKEKEVDHFKIEEIEQDNIVADIKTGLNLDKIPNYLSDFLINWSKDPLISYIPIHLPFQIELKEVEAFLGGELTDINQIIELRYFLDRENAKVKKQINDNGDVWQTYEPTLARHLSKSTLNYYDRVIHSELITDQIEEIKFELNTKRERPDDN